MQKRRCLIYASFPITCFTVPIIGHTELYLTTDEIYKCLCAKAQIDEILPNGKRVALDFSNYDKINKSVTTPIVQDTVKLVDNINDAVTVSDTISFLDDQVYSTINYDKILNEIKEEPIIENVTDIVTPVEETVVEKITVEEPKKEINNKKNDNYVKTHELSSRNNNIHYQKNKKNKNRR